MKIPLQKILQAYNESRSKLSLQSVIYSGTYFSDKTGSLIKKNVSLNEYLICKRIMVLSAHALTASRQKKLQTAELYYKQANFEYWLRLLGLQARLHCVSSLCSTKAYFKYCENNFVEAQQIIFQANDADIILEEKFGIYLLHMHRIQLAHNLIRIDVKTGNYSRALSRSIEAIQYLNSSVFNISYLKGPWGSSFLKRIQPSLIRDMTIQILHEMALGNSAYQWNDGLKEILHGYYTLIDTTALQPRFLQWLRLKINFHERKIDIFLEETMDFMKNERGNTSLLYFLLIPDLISTLEKIDPDTTKQLCIKIRDDLPMWTGTPRFLKEKIKKCVER